MISPSAAFRKDDLRALLDSDLLWEWSSAKVRRERWIVDLGYSKSVRPKIQSSTLAGRTIGYSRCNHSRHGMRRLIEVGPLPVPDLRVHYVCRCVAALEWAGKRDDRGSQASYQPWLGDDTNSRNVVDQRYVNVEFEVPRAYQRGDAKDSNRRDRLSEMANVHVKTVKLLASNEKHERSKRAPGSSV